MTVSTIKRLLLAAGLGLTAAALSAAPIEFDFKDPKGVNNIVFQLDAPLESINGTATGISGNVHYDPDDPASLKGRIVVEAGSLHVGNPLMREHLHGNGWLNVQAHPEIQFEVESVDAYERTDERNVLATLSGTMTIKGVAKPMTVQARLTYLPGMLRARGGIDADGDLLVVRSDFPISRTDFGIRPGQNLDRVADEIRLTLSLAGIAPRG
ncbi:MAG: YceI family protein [Puniceicoccaceae bacterium]|nr:MAG: YceI family protein [Puniceicoccaceae bacterium]